MSAASPSRASQKASSLRDAKLTPGSPSMSSPKPMSVSSRVQSPMPPGSSHAAADRRMSTSTTATGKRSLDPNARPASMRGQNSEKPWIGTFNFENQEQGLNGNSTIDENDVEKQSQDSIDFDKDEKGDGKHDPNVIDWDGPNDPGHPQNFAPRWKWGITGIVGSMTFAISFASSIWSSTTMVTAMQFDVSPEVMLLGTSLFVIGFAAGPILFGPLSELYGRKWPLYIGYGIFGIFNIPVAVAQNLYTIFLCRFFGGFFASAPLAIVGGIIADLHDPVSRGYGMAIFSGATFVGPAMGPVIGDFVVASYLGWRWVPWLIAILSLTLCVTTVWVVPETFAPLILSQRAKKLRFETKNWALHAPLDEKQVSVKELSYNYVLRPLLMMAQEPILLLITLYMSLIYGILYLFFEAFPVAFEEVRGLPPGLASLPFLSLLVGLVVGAGVVVLITRYRFAPVYRRVGHVVPEERLIPMFIGGVFLPAGLFWFGWTSNPHINIWAQIVSIIPIGAGVLIVFVQGLSYIVDVYTSLANSAIAANTIVRSLVGGGFIMFATGMFHDLGVPWATSLLAFLCVALYPAPIVFFFYGEKIRGMSRFSPK